MFVVIITLFIAGTQQDQIEAGYFHAEHACTVAGRAFVQDIINNKQHVQATYECVFVETGEAA